MKEPHEMLVYRWKLPYLQKALNREVKYEDPKPTSPFAHAWITLEEHGILQKWLDENNKNQ